MCDFAYASTRTFYPVHACKAVCTPLILNACENALCGSGSKPFAFVGYSFFWLITLATVQFAKKLR